jgi:signal transduction histidine kinase
MLSRASVSTEEGVLFPPSPSDLGELFSALGSATDALRQSHVELGTRVKFLERQIAAKDRALERKRRLEALGKIAAGVAHEIRNPLGSLSLYLDLLEQEVGDKARGRELVGSMRKGVALLSTTVNDILTFTEPGRAHPAPCDITDLLEEAIALARGGNFDAVAVVRAYPRVRREARVDADWVRRIFLNIVKNAYQTMPEGGALHVRVKYGSNITVRIRDTGPGIPAESLDKAFLPFWSMRDGGTGLGLSIVHSLVERHQGKIELSNYPEGGLEAKIILPWELNDDGA